MNSIDSVPYIYLFIVSAEEEDCYDQSTYCHVVKETKLCEISQFRLQCCASCGRKK